MIILASQSSGRLATLRHAGIEPQVQVSHVDETALLTHLTQANGGLTPAASTQVQALAQAKALAVAKTLAAKSPALVVGCDSMLEINGQVVGKPPSPQAARERWQAMRARSGVLHTGHAVVFAGTKPKQADLPTPAPHTAVSCIEGFLIAQGTSAAVVHFGSPSDAEIDAYIASGEPAGCAGAFTIDGLGGAFIDGIEGDPHGVVGISLPLLRQLIANFSIKWTDLWNCPSAN